IFPRLVRLDPDLPTVELRDLVLQPLRRHVSPVVNETDGAARAGATDVDDVLTCRFVESAAIVGDLEGDLVRAGLERVTQLLAGTEVHAVDAPRVVGDLTIGIARSAGVEGDHRRSACRA